jgi:uncharacterized membrane protein
MFNRIDRSTRLSKFLDNLSNTLARQRGLTVIIGIMLVIVSFVVQVIAVFAPSPALNLMGVIALHAGVLTALIGLLLVTPLGR